MALPIFLRKIKKNLASYLPSPIWPWEIISGLLIAVLLINNSKNIFGENAPNKTAVFSLVIIIVSLFWGAIDGLMFVFTSILERGRYNKTSKTVKSLDEKSAKKLIINEVNQIMIIDTLGEEIKRQIIDAIYKEFLSDKLATKEKIKVLKDDII